MKVAVLCQVTMATFNSDEVNIVVTNNLNVLNNMVIMLNVIAAAQVYETGNTGSGRLVINGKGIFHLPVVSDSVDKYVMDSIAVFFCRGEGWGSLNMPLLFDGFMHLYNEILVMLKFYYSHVLPLLLKPVPPSPRLPLSLLSLCEALNFISVSWLSMSGKLFPRTMGIYQ